MSQVRGRPFQPGNTYGRGRPKGSRNKITSEMRRILDEASLSVLAQCILQAQKGHFPSQRLVVDLLRRMQPIRPRRSRVKKIASIQDLHLAAEQVALEMFRGETTGTEAQSSMNTLEQMGRLLAQRDEEKKAHRPPKQLLPDFMMSALKEAHARRFPPPASPNGEMEAASADPPPM